MGRWPRLKISGLMIGIALLAVLLDVWRVDRSLIIIMGLQGLLFLPLLWLPHGKK